MLNFNRGSHIAATVEWLNRWLVVSEKLLSNLLNAVAQASLMDACLTVFLILLILSIRRR